MTSELSVLRRLVVENPDDVGMRRVFADALLDRQDPYGEFVQVQCELADLPPDAPTRPKLEAVERSLLKRNRDRWLARVGITSTHAYEAFVFVRGFLECWTCWPDDFIRFGPRVVTQTPLRKLVLSSWGPREAARATQLVAVPEFRALRALTVGAREAELNLLCRTDLQRLDELTLCRPQMAKAASIAPVLKAPWARQLRKLALEDIDVSHDDVAALVASHLAPYLTQLRVADRIGLHRFESLQKLSIWDWNGDFHALSKVLCVNPNIASLTLTAGRNESAIGLMKKLPVTVSALRLMGFGLTRGSVNRLVGSSLQRLDLLGCQVEEIEAATEQLQRRFGAMLSMQACTKRPGFFARLGGWG